MLARAALSATAIVGSAVLAAYHVNYAAEQTREILEEVNNSILQLWG
jgi:hypothetical protein